MTNSEKIDGLMYPTQKSFPPGAGNHNQAAYQSTQQNAGKLDAINKLSGGKKRKTKKMKKYRKYRGGSQITIPKMHMLYATPGGPETGPNAQIAGLSKISTQGDAWRKTDNFTATGGKRKRKKGGNPNWYWPCMSGGKKKTKKSHKKSKQRKHSRHSRRK